MHCRTRMSQHLDPSWQAWFADLQIVHEPGGTTLLIGSLPDQAALSGVLLTIRRLGLGLLALETDQALPVDAPDDRSPCSLRKKEEHRMKTFQGKVAVITGAASGIDCALAVRCIQEGMQVVLTDVELHWEGKGSLPVYPVIDHSSCQRVIRLTWR